MPNEHFSAREHTAGAQSVNVVLFLTAAVSNKTQAKVQLEGEMSRMLISQCMSCIFVTLAG